MAQPSPQRLRIVPRRAGRAVILSLWLAMPTSARAQNDSLVIDVLGQITVRRDLAGLPRQNLSMGFHGGAPQRFSGVTLEALLLAAGFPGGGAHGAGLARYVAVEASDGYRVVFGAGELDTSLVSEVLLLADSVDGRPLEARDGHWRLVASADRRGARSARLVTAIRVREAGSRGTVPPSLADSSARDLLRLEDQWAVGMVRRDTALFRRMLALGFVYTENDQTVGRDDVLQGLVGTDTVQAAHNEAMEVHAFGTTALVTGWLVVSGHGAKGPFTRRYRFTDTWVRRGEGGQWQIVGAQDYLVPPNTRGPS